MSLDRAKYQLLQGNAKTREKECEMYGEMNGEWTQLYGMANSWWRVSEMSKHCLVWHEEQEHVLLRRLASCSVICIKNITCILRNITYINLLKPTGHVMHQQFNIQQLYVLPTLYLYVLYFSENKQRLFPYTALTDWFV